MKKGKLLIKVAAFVTRDVGGERELLIFRHPQAGIQLPAGTVELGEKPEVAVIREVEEETGISLLEMIAELGSTFEKVSENEKVVLRMTKLFDAASFDASSDGLVLDRGLVVRVLDSDSDFSYVECEPMDTIQVPPLRRIKVRGYVRNSLLTVNLKRYYYHLRSVEKTRDSWQVDADGHIFDFFWKNLNQKDMLNSYQQPWLDRYREKIVS